jgi:hypothetical protein
MRWLSAAILCGIHLAAGAQQRPDNAHRFFVHWGYNESVFTRSDIHFHGNGYNFTLHNLRARDRPSPFNSRDYLNPAYITIPQFNVRAGFFLNNRISVSLGQDHMKYVVDQNQTTTITGNIQSPASYVYAGNYSGDSILLTPDFVRFEHTDGFNLVSADVEYALPFLPSKKCWFEWNSSVGAALMVPRTQAWVLNKGKNTNFHIAGFAFSARTGVSFHFLKALYFQADVRSGWARLGDVLINDPQDTDRAAHHVGFLEWYAVFGGRFRLWKAKEPNGKPDF